MMDHDTPYALETGPPEPKENNVRKKRKKKVSFKMEAVWLSSVGSAALGVGESEHPNNPNAV